MKFYKLNGRTVNKSINKYLIDWDKKSRSKFQYEVKQFLRPFWERYVCYEEMNLAGTRLSLDIVNMTKSIAVEVHGDQHKQFVPHFHNGSRHNYRAQIERDVRTAEWCELNNIKLVEIYTDDLPISTEWFWEKYEIKL